MDGALCFPLAALVEHFTSSPCSSVELLCILFIKLARSFSSNVLPPSRFTPGKVDRAPSADQIKIRSKLTHSTSRRVQKITALAAEQKEDAHIN